MGEPHFDYEQTLRFFRMLYRHGDRYFLWAYRAEGGDALYGEDLLARLQSAKGGWHLESSFGVDGFEHMDDPRLPVIGGMYRQKMRNLLVTTNITSRLEVAASVPTYGPDGRRTAANATHLGAFGVDVDPKNFEAIVPGGNKAAVIAAVIKTLASRGISQHAIVDSGNGFHVYLAIEHLHLLQEDNKDRAKLVWAKLCALLGGSTDRHDLASVLRVPGSVNWKGGKPRPVFFVEEHCDLDKPRYRLKDLEEALGDVEVRLPSKPGAKNQVSGGVAPEAQTELLDLALSVDKQLRSCLEAARVTEVGVRSQADFNLGCRMFRLGLPESLIRHVMLTTTKALSKRDPNGYASLTVSGCKSEVFSSNSPTSEDTWMVVNNSPQGLHIYDMDHHNRVVGGVGKQAASSVGGDGGDGSNSDQTVRVVVVLARPGDGKTMDLLDALGHQQRVPGDRLALCGGLTGELLRHEYLINASFPSGFTDSSPGDLLGQPPKDHAELFNLLPAEVQQHWPPERLQKAGVDLHGFLLNSLHPRDADRRLEPNLGPDDDEKQELDRLRAKPPLPAAVLKFKAQRRWCLAGHSSKKLRADAGICSRCPLVACRANTSNNEYERGAKTYWRTASVQLLSHRAYQFQEAFSPGKNNFDTLVFDELPDFVYRSSTVEISPKDFRGKQLNWNVEPIDRVLDALQALPQADDPPVVELIGALREGREFLTALAARRRQAIIAGTDNHRCWRVDEIKPLLGARQFQALLKLLGDAARADADEGAVGLDDGDGDDEGPAQLSDALLGLRDFCSDEPELAVLMEDNFINAKVKVAEQIGKFYVMRPVNGWPAVLGTNGSEGHQRRVLLDATAGVDPRYLLAGQFHEERFPTASFPGTTVVITDQTSRTSVKKLSEKSLVEQVVKDIEPYRYRIEKGLLVLCNMEEATQLAEPIDMAVRLGRLPAKTRVAHFRALRGRNDLADLDSVYFLNPFRLPPRCYVGLDLLLSDFVNAPRQWQQTNKRDKNEVLLARCLAADIYQDAMRIKLRKEPASRCMVFLPIKKLPAVVTRVARLFQDATFIVDGVEMRSSKASITLNDWVYAPRAPAIEEQSVQDEDDLPAEKEATTWTGEQHQYFRGQINCFFRPRARTESEADRLLDGFWRWFFWSDRLFVQFKGNEGAAWTEASEHLEPFLLEFRKANPEA